RIALRSGVRDCDREWRGAPARGRKDDRRSAGRALSRRSADRGRAEPRHRSRCRVPFARDPRGGHDRDRPIRRWRLKPDMLKDPFVLADREYRSRLILGTGKYKDFEETRRAVEASGAEIVTVAVRRVNITDTSRENLLDYI